MKNSSAFTLIELLVVVLIIGILAAVALPQYQRSIVKSRLANIKQTLASIKEAEEIYYLSNGEYTRYVSDLDINLPTCPPRVLGSDVLLCDGYFMIDPLQGEPLNTISNLTAYYCPNEVKTKKNSVECAENADFYYRIWLNHSNTPNRTLCQGNTTLGQTVCAGA